MAHNDVWDSPDGKVERYKAILVAKGYSQRDDIDYKETFSLVSIKDAFRVVMALVAHFDFGAFSNGCQNKIFE